MLMKNTWGVLSAAFVGVVVASLSLMMIATVSAGQSAGDWSKGHKEIATLTGHEQGIVGVVFSPCGKYVTLANKDFFLNIWDAATGTSVARMDGLNSWPQYVAFSPDSAVLAAGDLKKVRLWNVPSGEELMVLEGGEGPIAWRPDGTRLAAKLKSSSAGYQLKLFGFPGGELMATSAAAHEKLVRHVSWSPDGETVASSGDDGTLRLWDGNTLAEVRVLQGEGRVGRFRFSGDGTYIAAISGEDPGSFMKPAAALVWEVATGKQVLKIDDFKKGLESLCFSPDGKTLATGDRGNRARLWAIPSGAEVKEFADHKYWVSGLAFSPDGRFLAATTADEVVMWDVAGGKKLWSLVAASKGLTSVAFGPHGSRLVVTSTDNTAKVLAPTGN